MRKELLKNELHKVKREICLHGTRYEFKRDILDEYKEPTGEKKVITTCGLFHITKDYIQFVTANSDGSNKVRGKGQPMVLVCYEDAKYIKSEDVVKINGRNYKINHVNNIQEMNIVADISLELVLDGND